ncbi:MAG: hypothetical protein KCHDKBKB_00940 [Elusimicrobia bacterium]|nr:hypothetical protein [Elusimicrobiota bacterium]
MIRFLFVLSTLIVGSLLHIFLGRYLSLYEAAPHVLLLLTLAQGFLMGPIMGEIVGFFFGLLSDSTGTRLFGLNAVILAFAGFLAGTFRRRVASERLTAQVAIALFGTLYYSFGMSTLHNLFDESYGRLSLVHFILKATYNAVFMPVIFYLTERWVNLWRIQQEHM